MPLEEMVEIHCRGCRRMLGIGPADFRVYCNTDCANDFPATAQEGRDAVIEVIFQTKGLAKAAIGEMFGMSRQRIDQILQARAYKTVV